MKKTKIPNEMSIEEINEVSKLYSVGFLLSWPILGLMFYSDPNQTYNVTILIIGIIIVLGCVINIILIKFRRCQIQVFYLGIPFIFSLILFEFYLVGIKLLMPVAASSKILLFLNIFIVELILIIKRFIIKNKEFIKAYKIKKHGKYIIFDFILGYIVGFVVIIIAKEIDVTSIQQSVVDLDTALRILIGLFLLILAAIGCEYSLISYYYEGRFRKNEKY